MNKGSAAVLNFFNMNYNDIEIIYSGRRTLAAEVDKNLRVKVRAPFGTSSAEIRDFILSHEEWIDSAVLKMQKRTASLPVYPESAEVIKALKLKAEKLICPKIDYYAELLGVEPQKVGFTAAKTRFGSCSRNNSINFSCFLALYDEDAVDYVVVHELCHIKQKNHSKAFYALVASVMPDYKRREKLLKGKN